jgi:hypothetical protein
MRFTLAIFFMLVYGTTATLAQYGVSNARDSNGNLIRNTGMNPVRSNPAPVNTIVAPNTSAPARTPHVNSRTNNGTSK